MTRYSVFLHEDVLASAPKSGRHRRLVIDFLRQLGSAPHQHGDYTDRDEAGHTLEVKLVGRYAITFWADHAAKEVKVIHIQPADE